MTQPPAPPTPPQRPTIPRRVIGVLMAVMLTGGMVTGAVLGPASAGSLTSSSPIVQRALALLAAQALSASHTSAAAASTPPAESTTVTQAAPAHAGKSKPASHTGSPQAAPPNSSSRESAASTPSSSGGSSSEGSSEREKAAPGPPIRLPPIQHVWLIMLSGGSTFADATATPTSYPYLVGQLIEQGTLLTSYSALDGYELAGDAALLPGGVGAGLSVISEPRCSAASAAGTGTPCAEGAEASPPEADSFLQRVVGSIASSPAYREDGLIVIIFVLASDGAGVPAATVALQPTTGALLLTPLLHGGVQSSSHFDPLSPRTSLETIFKR
jgi:hypothetical protein